MNKSHVLTVPKLDRTGVVPNRAEHGEKFRQIALANMPSRGVYFKGLRVCVFVCVSVPVTVRHVRVMMVVLRISIKYGLLGA